MRHTHASITATVMRVAENPDSHLALGFNYNRFQLIGTSMLPSPADSIMFDWLHTMSVPSDRRIKRRIMPARPPALPARPPRFPDRPPRSWGPVGKSGGLAGGCPNCGLCLKNKYFVHAKPTITRAPELRWR